MKVFGLKNVKSIRMGNANLL